MTDNKLFEQLREEISQMPVIDSHEHLKSERDRIETPSTPFNLGYVGCDLCGSGISDEDAQITENAAANPEAAKKIFLRHLEYTRTTGYGRSLARTLKGSFGIDTLDESTFDVLWEKVSTGVKPGCYEDWLKKKYNIRAVVMDVEYDDEYPSLFYHAHRHHGEFAMVDNRDDLEKLESMSGCSIHSAGELRDAMFSYLEDRLEKRQTVALKNNLAYVRSLNFERATEADADRAFNHLFADKFQHHAQTWIKTPHRSYAEMQPLQNYMVHQSIRFAEDHGIAYQIHTGLHSGYTNEIQESNPTLLTNLFREYRKVPFVLFHGGFPYCREWGVLGKNFPNVYLDLCWMHIISPATMVQMLDEWLDYVPNNKILGFGGDFHLIESIYGHLEQARDNLARVLARKVERGDYDRSTALELARRMLFDNVAELYKLEKDTILAD